MRVILKLLASLFVMVLAACQGSLLTPRGGILYATDFSEGGDWPAGSAPGGASGVSKGGYQISVLEPDHQLWALADHSWQDVQVEVTATRLAGPLSNRYGVICRAQDDNRFYFFIISSDGYYAIGQSGPDGLTLLGQEMMAQTTAIQKGDGPNRLRFDCIGETLAGYVNGEMVAITTGTDYDHGRAGLLAGSFEEGGVLVEFDDFVVIKP